MKINLGCGKKILTGYTNVDFVDFGQEIIMDAFKYLEGLPDKSVDHIRAEHFLEHFRQEDVRRLLNYCHQKLKDNGEFYIVVPIWNKDRTYILTHYTFFSPDTFKVLEESHFYGFYGFYPWTVKELVVNDRGDIHVKLTPKTNVD